MLRTVTETCQLIFRTGVEPSTSQIHVTVRTGSLPANLGGGGGTLKSVKITGNTVWDSIGVPPEYEASVTHAVPYVCEAE